MGIQAIAMGNWHPTVANPLYRGFEVMDNIAIGYHCSDLSAKSGTGYGFMSDNQTPCL